MVTLRKSTRPPRNIRWKRVAIWGSVGLVTILCAVAGGSYLWFRSEVGAANEAVDPAVIEALGDSPGGGSPLGSNAGGATDVDSPGAPTGMNIVLLGADKLESEDGKPGRSDTVMLVHVDPDLDFLSLMSVPRDLRVEIPGHGFQKMNAAYTYGGAAIVIRTVQNELGLNLDHYVELDFNAFKEITDALGGVYLDVDRWYDDGKIQFAPGYQLMDGLNSLRFVRTRHDTNIDFGRMQRQQLFLSSLREQAMSWDLPFKLPGLIERLFSNVKTDLTANEILKLAYWATRLDSDRMKMATIVADIETVDGVSYVLASDEEIAAAAQGFLTPPPVSPGEDGHSADDEPRPPPATLKTADLAGISVDLINRSGRTGEAAVAAVWISRQGAGVNSARSIPDRALDGSEVAYPPGARADAELVAQVLGIDTVREVSLLRRPTVTLGKSYAIILQSDMTPAQPHPSITQWSGLVKETTVSLLAPSYLPATCSYSYFRVYTITVGEEMEPAYRVGYKYGNEDQYLCLNGTTWLDAPLASGGEEVEADGTVFTLVGSSTKTDRVWWTRDKVLYWVGNTLLYELSKEDLLAVALSAVEVLSP